LVGPRLARRSQPKRFDPVAESIRELFFGGPGLRGLVETINPRRSFQDVVLAPATLDAINHALQVIRKHDLLFRQWGLGERHNSGLGLAFHFAGPPGTGKTICAEALAHALGRQLMVVRYSGLESRWAGQTAKHLETVFRAAEEEGAVLFFDEADAIAGRRFATAAAGYEREANSVVNVLLQELERFDGVLIFATNLAVGIDPAFERRIRTHILFQLPEVEEREKIWRTQLHPRKTPLADDVDFRALAEAFPRSGGDIKNAVLKAAQLASMEPGPDAAKRIHQRHFEQGMREVIQAAGVMSQSLFEPPGATASEPSDPLIDRLEARFGGRLPARSEVEATAAALGATLKRTAWLAGAALLLALGALVVALVR
jgi:SpoVK/Ycf46/Vps4 family AAA+-type ATPase